MTFKEFQSCKRRISAKEFSQISGASLNEIDAPFVFLYQWKEGIVSIDINAQNEYGLGLDRDYHEGNGIRGLEKMEKKLYDFCVAEGHIDSTIPTTIKFYRENLIENEYILSIEELADSFKQSNYSASYKNLYVAILVFIGASDGLDSTFDREGLEEDGQNFLMLNNMLFENQGV